MIIWFLGKPNSGKTSIAEKVYDKFSLMTDKKCIWLDGDDIRKIGLETINEPFSKENRISVANSVRVAAKLFQNSGYRVIVSLVTPFESTREINRNNINDYYEIYCQCHDEVLISRDGEKGTYDFGVDINDYWEEPKNPSIVLYTDKEDIEECAKRIHRALYFRKNFDFGG